LDLNVFNDEHSKIWKHFETFTEFIKYNHLENHMGEVKPLIEYWNQALSQYKKDNIEAKQILRRFDEVLLAKASKFTVENIEAKIRDFWHRDTINELKQFVDFKNSEIRLSIQNVEANVQMNHDNVGEMITNTTAEMEQILKHKIREFLETKTISPNEVSALLSSKADKWDILEIDVSKADKSIVDENIK
jgi:integrase